MFLLFDYLVSLYFVFSLRVVNIPSVNWVRQLNILMIIKVVFGLQTVSIT